MCDAAQIHPDIETLHGKPIYVSTPPPPPPPPPPPTRFTSLPVVEARLAWPPAPLSQRWAATCEHKEKLETGNHRQHLTPSRHAAVTAHDGHGKLVCNPVSTSENLTSRSELQFQLGCSVWNHPGLISVDKTILRYQMIFGCHCCPHLWAKENHHINISTILY